MEKQVLAISKEEFSNKRFLPIKNYLHATNDSVAPVLFNEANQVSLELPLAFFKKEDEFELFGILSFLESVNPFVDANGNFHLQYIPVSYRTYPFLVYMEKNGEQILCFDQNSGLLTENQSEGFAFYDNDEISAELDNKVKMLQEIQKMRVIGKRAIELLGEKDLFTKWDLKVNVIGQEQSINNLYTINENRLYELKGEELVELRDSGALALAYIQLLSRANISKIEAISRIYLAAQQKKAAANQEALVNQKGDLDLEFLKNDTISFG
ncbi:hypothetical protein CCZ01_02160 [Helicobacter monodelphidis]|uniref:SapC family protein n=1 Tax=Helicobacter sp. 15-1451 TaxID=2004995 RepID=UPI000DCE98E4|nr:SapC family protein [Helicobacter sp. 15-1451]RAX58611.1 hypothetical protein CCZ01_02160 [Helicobacter sp. 15-1451]